MKLTKVINGVSIECSEEETLSILHEWQQNTLLDKALPKENSLEEKIANIEIKLAALEKK